MNILKQGATGEAVTTWQYFLIGEGHSLHADGDFGKITTKATKAWQKKNGLTADGIVGMNTFGKAVAKGMYGSTPLPQGYAPMTYEQRCEVFGVIPFKHTPTDKNPEKVTILGDWEKENIVRIKPPIVCPKFTSSVRVHKLAAPQFMQVYTDIEDEGLADQLLSYEGAYTPRFIRGSRTTLSNHAHGTAIDHNAKYNGLGKYPANGKGSVRDLVPHFENNGFYWGGNFKRRDGMHFEICRIIN